MQSRDVAAEKALQESIAILEKLAEEFPADPDYRTTLADSYITVTPLKFDLTDHARLAEMAAWGWKVGE